MMLFSEMLKRTIANSQSVGSFVFLSVTLLCAVVQNVLVANCRICKRQRLFSIYWHYTMRGQNIHGMTRSPELRMTHRNQFYRCSVPGALQRYSPWATAGNGNCCFRAVLLAMLARTTTVRLLTAWQTILHPEYSDQSSLSWLLKGDHIEIPAVQHAMTDVVKDEKYVELMHLRRQFSTGRDYSVVMHPTAVLVLQ